MKLSTLYEGKKKTKSGSKGFGGGAGITGSGPRARKTLVWQPDEHQTNSGTPNKAYTWSHAWNPKGPGEDWAKFQMVQPAGKPKRKQMG